VGASALTLFILCLILNTIGMELIAKFLVRHAIFVAMSFLSLYLVALTFTAPINFFTWDLGGRVLFAVSAHVIAFIMHGWWFDNR
jgi:hypothetical protein